MSVNGWSAVRIGVWVWGIATVILAGICLVVVGVAALTGTIDARGMLSVSGWAARPYAVLKSVETLLAAILGASGLGWAHFFTVFHDRWQSPNAQQSVQPDRREDAAPG